MKLRSTSVVVLQKLDDDESRPIIGRIKSMPQPGCTIVVEMNNAYEYVTSPVVRFLRSGDKVIYVETMNSKYKMTINDGETT